MCLVRCPLMIGVKIVCARPPCRRCLCWWTRVERHGLHVVGQTMVRFGHGGRRRAIRSSYGRRCTLLLMR